MKRHRIPIIVVGVTLMLTGCATTQTEYKEVSGHPYKTKLDCERKKPLGTFDEKCDAPVVGFSGFGSMSFPVQTGGGGASGPSF